MSNLKGISRVFTWPMTQITAFSHFLELTREVLVKIGKQLSMEEKTPTMPSVVFLKITGS